MSNYTKTTNFAAKDSLPSGNANKIVKGTEIDTEFDNIATASATKADIAGPTFTGTVTIPTVDLNGGAIDGTTVGASTAAAITGTTIVANTSINIAGDGATVTGIKDEDDMSSNSATKLATQQSIKAYVDSQVTAQDLDFQADSGGALSIDLDSETLTFTGGTGVDTSGSGNAVTFAIDSTVATLTGTQTLTNKTLTSPTLNTPTIGTSFTIGSATITEAELEILDGATVTTAELNVLDGITSTTAELNILDGVTSTAAELNILDGVTSTAAELNILDGVTSTAAELNILDGVTATTAELNIMDGVTATTAELNYVDGVTSNVQTQLDAKAPIASPTFTGTVTVPGLTTSADILFGDNDKAIFGAGSDLQIYHDGSHSYIDDAGTGNLKIRTAGTSIRLETTDGDRMLVGTKDGDFKLYYDDVEKLATTSTGIDVTGTATMDGLTVDGVAAFNANNINYTGSSPKFNFFENDATDVNTQLVNTVGDFYIKTVSDDAGTTTNRFSLDHATGDISFYNSAGTSQSLFWDASAERLGIGTTSPSKQLHQIRTGSASDLPTLATETGFITQSTNAAASSQNISIIAGASGESRLFFGDTADEDVGHIIYNHASNYMLFSTAATGAMRIDSNQNLLVGKTSTTFGTVGVENRADGRITSTRSGNTNLLLNRLSSDGDIVQFYKDGTAVGSIGSRSGNLFITYTSNGYGLTGTATSNAVIPSFNGATSDNAVDLGASAVRFDDIYATNGTIQTSDRNEKQDIEALSDAEQRVAVACKGLLRKFRWKSSVEEKGDNARIHFGIIAQDLQDAFSAEGLDAGRYAMFISSTWTDDDGNEQTRLGVRYSELLAFIISAI